MAKRSSRFRALLDRLGGGLRSPFREYHETQRARRNRAEAQLKDLSDCSRRKFCDEVLVNLMDAGWHEGRTWDVVPLTEFERRFHFPYPPIVHQVLMEFGGLKIGLGGRIIVVGDIDEDLCSFRHTLSKLVGSALYPVGQTNIFEDDGLGVHLDADGRVFVDGATGEAPPNDYRIELIASAWDRCLDRLFSGERPPPSATWDYSPTVAP